MTDRLVILLEDEHCLAVAKPAGLPTQGPESGGPTLEAAIRRHLRPDDPGSAYLGTVHRLDRPVSGVILWAKTAKAARRLAAQFAGREARKEYWAVVSGRPDADQGVWDDWLGPNPSANRGRVRICQPDDPRARRATTRYRVGQADRLPPGRTWLRLWPKSGRTHQLRVQSAGRRLPILGDHVYGSPEPFPAGIALHARALGLRHPVLGTPLRLVADPPPAWLDLPIELPPTDDDPGGERWDRG